MAAAQTTLNCKLTAGTNLENCDVAQICSASFDVNSVTKTIRQTDGLYTDAMVKDLTWNESTVFFSQSVPDSDKSVKYLVRSQLNRLTGEMHVRADWLYLGVAKYTLEVWQCEVRKPLF